MGFWKSVPCVPSHPSPPPFTPFHFISSAKPSLFLPKKNRSFTALPPRTRMYMGAGAMVYAGVGLWFGDRIAGWVGVGVGDGGKEGDRGGGG